MPVTVSAGTARGSVNGTRAVRASACSSASSGAASKSVASSCARRSSSTPCWRVDRSCSNASAARRRAYASSQASSASRHAWAAWRHAVDALESAWPRSTSASYNACMACTCSWYMAAPAVVVGDDLRDNDRAARTSRDTATAGSSPRSRIACTWSAMARAVEREQSLGEASGYSFTFDARHGGRDRALGIAGDESHLRPDCVERKREEAGLLRKELVSPGEVRLRLRRPTLPPSQQRGRTAGSWSPPSAPASNPGRTEVAQHRPANHRA